MWENVPKGATALAVVAEDPDAPGGTFTHWIIYNIPPKTSGLNSKIPQRKHFKDGAVQVENDMNTVGYGEPCPPKGEEHRYLFRLLALNKKLPPEGINPNYSPQSTLFEIVFMQCADNQHIKHRVNPDKHKTLFLNFEELKR